MGDAATHGFLVGAFAAVIGLGIKALMAQHAEHPLASVAGVACALSGVIGGYVLFRLSEKLEVSCTGKYWSVAIAAASVTAPLGCIDLSRLQLVLLGTGLLVTATVGFLVRRFRHSPVVG
jgi:ABC-type Co2+ transport system permease subunit